MTQGFPGRQNQCEVGASVHGSGSLGTVPLGTEGLSSVGRPGLRQRPTLQSGTEFLLPQ